MIQSGLVSVSFRKIGRREIVEVAQKSGLTAIEWGGDIHVPHGDLQSAYDARTLTEAAGLKVAAYGSYFRFTADPLPFEAVLATALTLGAPFIRAWAGSQGSATVTPHERENIVNRIRESAEMAAKVQITLALEYHGGTLTDTVDSALALMQEIDHPSARLLWQPDPTVPHAQRLLDLQRVTPYLENLHVFQWTKPEDTVLRHPLAEGEPEWPTYLQIANAVKGDRFALLEFVPTDEPASLPSEAAVLNGWLQTLS